MQSHGEFGSDIFNDITTYQIFKFILKELYIRSDLTLYIYIDQLFAHIIYKMPLHETKTKYELNDTMSNANLHSVYRLAWEEYEPKIWPDHWV